MVWISATLMPYRAIARRSISMVRVCWPDNRSTRISRAPGTVLTICATCSDKRFNSFRSSPKILIANCERTPVSISSTRCAMGWFITTCTPGMCANDFRISSSISTCLRLVSGSSETIGLDSFGPDGSAGDSPRPRTETADRTPGIAATTFIASTSIFIASSSEILGMRMIEGVIEPSFMIGMKLLPRRGNSANETNRRITAAETVFFCEAIAAFSILR